MFMLKYALENPVKVLVAVLFIMLFGIQALSGMSYQLSPDVEYPTITVRTSWRGATPYEIEQEIVKPQENVLKSLAGLIEMESVANNGSGSITLQFELGTNLMDAMLLVSNKLNEVRNYPDNSDRPTIRPSGADSSPIIFMVFETVPGNENVIDSYRSYVDEEIIPRFERVDGVSEVFFFGGRPTQMHITVDPNKLAAYNISIDRLNSVLNQQNINTSAGLLPVGRKNFRVRTVSKFTSIEDINETLVVSDYGGIKVSDIAEVDFGYAVADSAVKYGDKRAMMIGIVNETGANVLEITDNIEVIVKELNAGVLAERGLTLRWIYDQRPYINGAISLVKENIVVGGILAILTLLLFLRKTPSTIIIAVAIPISVVGTFIVLKALGRTLNVICLAGIAFAVGILVDNAIVVLENIDRHLKMGKNPANAAIDGVSEVWGAVLSSTLTTISVFLPVVFVKQEAGQLFRDIAIAISSAVTISLFVSVFVIPVLTKLVYEHSVSKAPGRISIAIGDFGMIFTEVIMRISIWINDTTIRRVSVIVGFTVFSMGVAFLLYPKMEYLPQGNMNMVRTNIIVPSGLSLDERSELADIFYQEMKPYTQQAMDGYPKIDNFMYFINAGGVSAQATSAEAERAVALVPLMSEKMRKVPGVRAFTEQQGIFQNRGNGSRVMNVVVSGENLDELMLASRKIIAQITAMIPNVQVRPRPSLEMMFPEATFTPKRYQLADAGMTPASLGIALDTYVDGRKVGEFNDDYLGNIDMVLTYPVQSLTSPEDIADMPLAIAGGGIIPISNVAELNIGYGMEAIRRYERKRTYTLAVSPPPNLVLEQIMDTISNDVIAPLKADGSLQNIDIHFTGSASKLTEAKKALAQNFILALIITYLLMVALFDNFIYPLIIMFSVPLALAGGFIGFKFVDIFIISQSFDVLTMLGFVILIGVVVNNAILIVHQSLNNVRLYGIPTQRAIIEAVDSRLRPIFMSALAAIVGLLPLVLFPGPGSELYRGLGSVVLGGLALATAFTVFLVPAMLSLCMEFTEKK